MGDVVFYRDHIDSFECDVKIEGANSTSSRVRLVMEFSDRTLLFNGKIESGHVSISIPKLTEIRDSSGDATLEIVADQTLFEAWKSPFVLKNKKNVEVNEVNINSKKSTSVFVENVSKQNERNPNPIQSQQNGICLESCSKQNKMFVKKSFKKFESLSKADKKRMKQSLLEFEAKPTIKEWAENVFSDPSTMYAKYCMYNLQNGIMNK